MPVVNILPQSDFQNIDEEGAKIEVFITVEPESELTFQTEDNWITQSAEEKNVWIIAENLKREERTGKVEILYLNNVLGVLSFTQNASIIEAPVRAADWIDVMMTNTGAVNVAPSGLLVTNGAKKPVTKYDENLKMWTSHYDGGTGPGTGGTSTMFFNVKYNNSTAFREAVQKSFTMEVFCRSLDDLDRSPFSGMQGGGFGFRKGATNGKVPDGQQAAHAHIGGGYQFTGYPVTNNTDFYHYIFTYDGSKVVTYLNGEKVGTTNITGAVSLPGTAAQDFVIGGDTNNGAAECQMPFYGDIAFARIHGAAIDESDVEQIYGQIVKRKGIASFDKLNSELARITALPDSPNKASLLEKGWALMNSMATTEKQISSFLETLP